MIEKYITYPTNGDYLFGRNLINKDLIKLSFEM